MTITATMVKDLRDKTGAGMMDCKTALTESGGDFEQAIDWLRTKGLAKAAKKAGRIASEGLIGVAGDGNQAAVVEVNSETDFVARNETFQALVASIAGVALDVGGSLEDLARAAYPGKSHSVEDEVREAIATIGENISLRRSAALSVAEGVVASYVHNSVAGGLGKIGVLVALETSGDADKAAQFGKQLAMQVAATSPIAVSRDDIDSQTVERERGVYAEQARQTGKPENVVEKMVEGRLRKFYEEVVLLEQKFIMDTDKTVAQAIAEAQADIGAPVAVAGFHRFALGEGIEKKESDFASEVAAAAGGG